MRIGILSMQRVKNWGSFLQAFALQKTIEELGHECSFLDIKPAFGLNEREIIELNKTNHTRILLRNVRRFIYYTLTGQLKSRLKAQMFHKRFASKYEKEFLPLLGIDSQKTETNKQYDVVVIGSDEVFNCTQNSPYCKTLHLFGEGINARRIVSYAASAGYTDMERLEKHQLVDRVRQSLTNVSAVSVRDQNTYDVVTRLTGKSPHIHIDPVFIYNFDFHMPVISDRDYLIVYTYYDRISDSATIRAIKEYAKAKEKKILSFTYYSWCDKCVIPETPFELLAYFKSADYVVTDTFHGTVFSIKYNRNFCSIVRDSNRQKLNFLLSQLHLACRIANRPAEISMILDQEIDYKKTNAVIEDETRKAKTYLEWVLRRDINAVL